MTNLELMACFQSICKKDNAFDVLEALHDLEPKYKKSTFYKKTKTPIYKAYTFFNINAGLNVLHKLDSLRDPYYASEWLRECIDNIDSASLDTFLNKIIEGFGLDQVTELKGDLVTSLEKLKTLS